MSKRLVLLANNRVGLEGARLLRDAGADIVGLVVHERARAKHRDEIIAALDLGDDRVMEAPDLRTAAGLDRLRAWQPQLGLSLFYGDILRVECLALFPDGVLNVHPSLLPWGRGAFPNVWAIVERTPAGATLHYIDRGVDTGDLVAQRQVVIESWDTGASLYTKCEDASLALLRDHLDHLISGNLSRRPQPAGGSTHRQRDVETIDRIALDEPTTARALIDLLRARTFAPHAGAYYIDDAGRRINVRIELMPSDKTS